MPPAIQIGNLKGAHGAPQTKQTNEVDVEQGFRQQHVARYSHLELRNSKYFRAAVQTTGFHPKLIARHPVSSRF